MNPIIEKIKKEIAFNLPGESSHLLMSPLGRGKSSELLRSAHQYKKSSVALILLEQQQDLGIVLTKRATYKGVHSNQVSFPGGREEAFDSTPVDTAIRETREELNFDISTANQLGKMTDVFIPVSNFLVRPYVFHTNQQLIYENNREVVETFTVSVDELLDDHAISTMNVDILNGIRHDVPCFCINNHQIWGATAIVLNEFRELIRNVYK